jgi:regulator of sirC expression with transglutaminase-like and TPR domain
VTAESRERFTEVVRSEPVDLAMACLLLGAEVAADLEPEPYLYRLDALAQSASPEVAAASSAAEQAAALATTLGDRAGFGGSGADYLDLRSSLLHSVLDRRRGLPILLSVVWLEVAHRLGVPAYGVGLPGHFVVAIGSPTGESALVDPFAGGRLLPPTAAAEIVRSAGLDLTAEQLVPWSPVEILLRILNNVRQLAATAEHFRTRLWAVELTLLLPRHPLQVRREHGELLVGLGDLVRGAAELTAYAEAVGPVDPVAADRALQEARLARARLN